MLTRSPLFPLHLILTRALRCLVPVILLGLFLALPSCQCTQSPEPRTLPSEFQVGAAPFSSSRYSAVESLTFQKADPETGDSWTAEIRQSALGSADWQIVSAPSRAGGGDLLDRRADGRFIQHLLDTAMTLRVVEGIGTTDRTRLGLAPPVYALRWITPTHEYELKVGQVRSSSHRYAEGSVKLRSDPQSKRESGPMVVQGAILQMLALVKSFDTLRNRLLFPFDGDDIDEVEVKGRLVPQPFYMQRHGESWADRKKRPFPHSPEPWFAGLMHLRSLRFIDDPKELALVQAQLGEQAPFQVTLKDRDGKPNLLRARFIEKKLIATLSSRPEGAFQLYPDSIRFFLSPGRTAHDEPPRPKNEKGTVKKRPSAPQ